jgi:hypothetical protein
MNTQGGTRVSSAYMMGLLGQPPAPHLGDKTSAAMGVYRQGKRDRKRVTARKHGGDDAYSWAVFVDGRVMVNGLSRMSVDYYKRLAYEQIAKDAGHRLG